MTSETELIFQDIIEMGARIERDTELCLSKYRVNNSKCWQDLTQIIKQNYDYIKQHAARLVQFLQTNDSQLYINEINTLKSIVLGYKKSTCTKCDIASLTFHQLDAISMNQENVNGLTQDSGGSDFDKETVANLSPRSMSPEPFSATNVEEPTQTSLVFNMGEESVNVCALTKPNQLENDKKEGNKDSTGHSEGSNGTILFQLIADYFNNRKKGYNDSSNNKEHCGEDSSVSHNEKSNIINDINSNIHSENKCGCDSLDSTQSNENDSELGSAGGEGESIDQAVHKICNSMIDAVSRSGDKQIHSTVETGIEDNIDNPDGQNRPKESEQNEENSDDESEINIPLRKKKIQNFSSLFDDDSMSGVDELSKTVETDIEDNINHSVKQNEPNESEQNEENSDDENITTCLRKKTVYKLSSSLFDDESISGDDKTETDIKDKNCVTQNEPNDSEENEENSNDENEITHLGNKIVQKCSSLLFDNDKMSGDCQNNGTIDHDETDVTTCSKTKPSSVSSNLLCDDVNINRSGSEENNVENIHSAEKNCTSEIIEKNDIGKTGQETSSVIDDNNSSSAISESHNMTEKEESSLINIPSSLQPAEMEEQSSQSSIAEDQCSNIDNDINSLLNELLTLLTEEQNQDSESVNENSSNKSTGQTGLNKRDIKDKILDSQCNMNESSEELTNTESIPSPFSVLEPNNASMKDADSNQLERSPNDTRIFEDKTDETQIEDVIGQTCFDLPENEFEPDNDKNDEDVSSDGSQDTEHDALSLAYSPTGKKDAQDEDQSESEVELLEKQTEDQTFNLDEKKRDELLDMLTEYEKDRHRQKIFTEESPTAEDVSEETPAKEQEATSHSDENSEAELYDVVREEEVTFDKRITNKKLSAKAWDAFEELLEDDDISFDSEDESECNSNPEHVKDLSCEDRDETLRCEFNIEKELVVNVEQANFEDHSVKRFDTKVVRSRDDNSVIDRLCDLSTVLSGRKRKLEHKQETSRKRSRKKSGESSISLYSSLDESDDVVSSDEVKNSQFLDEPEDAQSALAAALWDNIKNSSDELLSDYESDHTTPIPAKLKTTKRKRVSSSSSADSTNTQPGKSVSSWRRDPLLHGNLSSGDENKKKSCDRASRRKRREEKRQNLSTCSSSDCDSDATILTSPIQLKESTSSSSETDDDDVVIINTSKTSPAKGRRNIRALVKDDDLALSTQQANEEEKARIKRLKEKHKVMDSQRSSQGDEELIPLVLDVHNDMNIEVDINIVKQLKPHQRDGIQFMWDSCYESVTQLKKGWHGSGCILAHCMGLGKTRQALTLIHTVYANPITNTKYVLVVCPLSTVPNWYSEYKLTIKHAGNSRVPIHTLQGKKQIGERFSVVKRWRQEGGILIMGYEAFGHMTDEAKLEKLESRGLVNAEVMLKALVNPGPDLIICDEGHLLRNKQTQRNISLSKVRTKRKIVLTGTPLQNNLIEYYCMVHFVKPNLLGTEREYMTNFVNPISNGQYEDSTPSDILLMKQRTHVLHKLLAKAVQRLEDTELKKYLPKLIDHAIFISLSEIQVRLYNTYLDDVAAKWQFRSGQGNITRKNLLGDVAVLNYICTHPYLLSIAGKFNEKTVKEHDIVGDNNLDVIEAKYDWCKDLLPDDTEANIELGTKIQVVLEVLNHSKEDGDKVLIFSQAHAEMHALEHFVKQKLQYKKGVDYMRMDGTTIPDDRASMCNKFNDLSNKTLKLFIMSTKVGGLGLNLTAANRIIIMTVNWNPSYDVQSIFRAFRFGQTKIVYVYRLIAKDTMEERRYNRQVTKLAVAHRVVDSYQVTRHFNSHDVQEMYSVRPSLDSTRPTPKVPEDKVLAKMIQKLDILHSWHEHQDLLANRPEEELNEHQKTAAWEDFNRKDELTRIPVNPVGPSLAVATPQLVRSFDNTPVLNKQMVLQDHNYTETARSINEQDRGGLPHSGNQILSINKNAPSTIKEVIKNLKQKEIERLKLNPLYVQRFFQNPKHVELNGENQTNRPGSSVLTNQLSASGSKTGPWVSTQNADLVRSSPKLDPQNTSGNVSSTDKENNCKTVSIDLCQENDDNVNQPLVTKNADAKAKTDIINLD